METPFRPFFTSLTMPMSGCEQPYGMLTSMMANLHINPLIFPDNVTNAYSPILEFGSSIPYTTLTSPTPIPHISEQVHFQPSHVSEQVHFQTSYAPQITNPIVTIPPPTISHS